MGSVESGNGKGETRNVTRRDAVRRFPFPASRFPALHGEGGIRTPDRGISPYNGLANRRLQPLGHLSSRCGNSQFTDASATPTSRIESGRELDERWTYRGSRPRTRTLSRRYSKLRSAHRRNQIRAGGGV